jgi:hypothetical protein
MARIARFVVPDLPHPRHPNAAAGMTTMMWNGWKAGTFRVASFSDRT